MTTMSVKPDPAYLAMPDAVNVNLLPAGYPAYLGYTDGRYQTANALKIMFPDAQLVLLTVRGQHLDGAHGARVRPGDDVEPGDMTAAAAAVWVREELTADPATRPVVYASVGGQAGYGMHDVLHELTMIRVPLTRVRLLSAHYGAGPHICGMDTCRQISTPMDGTQWTSSYVVPDGVVDMSLLRPDFFQPVSTGLNWTEKIVQELPIVRQGDSGPAVRTVQALCHARGVGSLAVPIDGVFGPITESVVLGIQHQAGITMDGIVGPQTWPVLLGVA